jgi:hypothetical protein
VLLNRDLGLQSRPEAVNRYFAVEFSMAGLALFTLLVFAVKTPVDDTQCVQLMTPGVSL